MKAGAAHCDPDALSWCACAGVSCDGIIGVSASGCVVGGGGLLRVVVVVEL